MNSQEAILRMIKEGVISVEEGMDLLDALKTNESEPNRPQPQKKPINKRMLRIDVNDEDGTKVKVNVPLALAKLGLDLGNQLNINGKTLDLSGIDLEAIIDQIDEDSHGDIVSVDTESGETVRIYID
jgi:hypothetical protein